MKGILREGNLGNTLFGSGSVGVPLFFMVSGFIMYITTSGKEPSGKDIKNYFLKRLIRIVPLYLICTLLSIIIFDQTKYYFQSHPAKLLPVIFFFPTGGSNIGASYGMPPLAVGWSLNYEMYFYLLVGICMFFPRLRWSLLFLFLLASVFLIPLLTDGYIMRDLSGGYHYPVAYLKLMTNPVHLFFLFGVLSGMFYRSKFSIPLKLANILVIVSMINFALTYFKIYQISSVGYVSSIFNCGFLLMALLIRNKLKPIQCHPSFVFTGNISYSLYLVHPLLLTGIPTLIRTYSINLPSTGWIYFCLILILIFFCSYLSYLLIEKTLTKKIQGWLNF